MAYLTNKELRAHNDKPDCRAYICPNCGVNFQTSDPRKKGGRNRYNFAKMFLRSLVRTKRRPDLLNETSKSAR